MAERYFLILVVASTVAGSLWLSFVSPLITYGIFLSSLLALLGLAAVANAKSAKKSGMLMPLFFIATIAYEFYLYLNGRLGVILISILLLSLVGLILGFGISPRKNPAKKAEKAVQAAALKQPRKKTARKAGRKRKK